MSDAKPTPAEKRQAANEGALRYMHRTEDVPDSRFSNAAGHLAEPADSAYQMGAPLKHAAHDAAYGSHAQGGGGGFAGAMRAVGDTMGELLGQKKE